MRPTAWLELTKKKPADIARDLDMTLITVWRHFTGLRFPNPNDIDRYREYTEAAITADDWVEFWNEPEPLAARAKEKATEQKRKAAA